MEKSKKYYDYKLDKIIDDISDSDKFNKCITHIENMKYTMSKPMYDRTEANEHLILFRNELIRVLNTYNNVFKKVIITINHDNTKFFGLYTINSSNMDLYHALFNKGFVEGDPEISMEIDNIMIRSLKPINILRSIIAELILNHMNPYTDEYIDYIHYYTAKRNKSLVPYNDLDYTDTSLRYRLFQIFSVMYLSFRCSIFSFFNVSLTREESDYNIFHPLFDIDRVLVDIYYDLSNSFIMPDSEIKLDKYEYISLRSINFVVNKMCDRNDDCYIYLRIKNIIEVTNVNILKNLCTRILKSINEDFTHIRLDAPISENVVEKIKMKYKKKVIDAKVRNFNNVLKVYQNRYYELKIKIENIDDEYNALVFVREINDIISILDEYIYNLGEDLTKHSLESIIQLSTDFKVLRSETMKKKVPKYSYLGIWTPKEYKRDNPYL